MTLADKWKQFTADPRAQKAGSVYKKAETGLWKALEPVGRGANKLAGRAGAEAFWPTELAEGELDKAARILRTFTLDGVQTDEGAEVAGSADGGSSGEAHAQVATASPPPSATSPTTHADKYAARKTQKVLRKIPPKALAGACGIAIMTCFRTGFGFSGASGSGVVLARLPDGSWSAPSGILIHTIGWGFLIGLDIYDVVLILRKPEALKAFEHPKVSIGGELSVSAGPVGNGAMLDAGLDASPCWSYTKSKGAYAGVQLDGTVVLKRDDANARFYGQQTSASEILSGRTKPTAPAAINAVRPLWQTLYAAEGRPDVMGTEHIPQGMAPGEIGISAEEASKLEEMSKAEQSSSAGDHDAGISASGNPSTSATAPKRFVPPALPAQPLPPPQQQFESSPRPAPTTIAVDGASEHAPIMPAQDAALTSAANTFDDSHAVPATTTSHTSTSESADKDTASGAPPSYSALP